MKTIARLHGKRYDPDHLEELIAFTEDTLNRTVVLGRNGAYGVKMFDHDEEDYRSREDGDRAEVTQTTMAQRSSSTTV